jgi:hypothetical protein
MNRLCWIVVFVLGAIAPALGQTSLSAEVGWENHYRPGRWTPIFVTAADASPRDVVLELYAPHDRRHAMRIQNGFTIGPSAVTIPLYVPLSYSLDETTLVLRSATSGRRLADIALAQNPIYARVFNASEPQAVEPNGFFIGLSGSSLTARSVAGQFTQSGVTVGYMPQSRLPGAAIGYDALDLLILNQPDLNRMQADQQEAIVQWVRAGGRLVIWPGAEPVAGGAILEILPARIGQNQSFQVDAKAIEDAGLSARFAKLKGRELSPLPGAAAVPMFAGSGLKSIPAAFRWRAGFGQVLLLPVDVSEFHFNDVKNSEAFWRRLLKNVAELPEKDPKNQNNAPNYYYNPNQNTRQSIGLGRTMDWMGNVPGAGKFGFSYIAVVLIGMMVVVGPLDFLVLKWLGRQPWTFFTTAGWIGLITLGAIFVGHVFKSGDLYFRTTSIIDEADGARVAGTNLAAIYSPRTTDYDLETQPGSWWEPASDETNYYGGGGGLRIDIPAHQDYRSCRLLPVLINVWNLRYFQGMDFDPAPGMLEADLSLSGGPGKLGTITGKITNRASWPISGIKIRTSRGVAAVPLALLPGQTLPISLSILEDHAFEPPPKEGNNKFARWQQRSGSTTQPAIATAADIASGRSDRIDQLLALYPDTACIYGEISADPGAMRLSAESVKQSHWCVVRSLVRMKS